MTSPRLLVALATYNEIENLPGLVAAIHGALPAADLLVVDDHSPDGTGDWCDEQARSSPWLKCLHRAGKLGLGTATIAAMRWAVESNYDVIITMDADWSHDPKHLPALVQATATADIVLGSRYCRGGAIEGWPRYRRIASRGLNFLTRLTLRLPVMDTSGAFRAYRVSALRLIDLASVRAVGYSYLEEILWHLRRAGASFTEVPITFHQRRAGESKISLGEAFAKFRTLIRLRIRRS